MTCISVSVNVLADVRTFPSCCDDWDICCNGLSALWHRREELKVFRFLWSYTKLHFSGRVYNSWHQRRSGGWCTDWDLKTIHEVASVLLANCIKELQFFVCFSLTDWLNDWFILLSSATLGSQWLRSLSWEHSCILNGTSDPFYTHFTPSSNLVLAIHVLACAQTGSNWRAWSCNATHCATYSYLCNCYVYDIPYHRQMIWFIFICVNKRLAFTDGGKPWKSVGCGS